MRTEKETLKCEAVFTEDGTHRVLLRKEWDKTKQSATIIMINPSSADTMYCDTTTMLVVNNLSKLGFGSVDIVNLYSVMTSKISFRFHSDEVLLCEENDSTILKSAEKSDVIILAWGSIGNNNARIKARQNAIFDLLKPFASKLKIITDEKRSCSFHPLAPQVRNTWVLKDYVMEVEHGAN